MNTEKPPLLRNLIESSPGFSLPDVRSDGDEVASAGTRAKRATLRAEVQAGRTPLATVAGLPVRVAWVYSALLLATLVGYSLLWPNAPLIAADTEAYRVVAVDMADGRLDRLWFRSPGYPFVMWLTGSTVQPTRALLYLGLALHLAAVWLVAGVLHRLRFSFGVLVFFGVVMSLPPFVEPAGYALTENLTEFLLAGSFASLAAWLWKDRLRYLVLSGAFIAFAALTRPTFQVTAGIFAIVLVGVSAVMRGSLRTRDAARASLIVLGVSVLGFGSFAAYNYRHHGVFSISPGNLAYSMTTKTVRVLEQLPDEYATEREILIAARDSHLVRRGSSHTGEQYWPTASRELERVTGRNELERFELISRLNFMLVREAPLTYVLEIMRSVPSFWFVAITPLTYGKSSLAHVAWALFHFGVITLFFLQLTVIGGRHC